MAALVDTNVLVYCYDVRFPDKRAKAKTLIREGIAKGDLCFPHQALLEFVAAVSRPLGTGAGILTTAEAFRELEGLSALAPVLYPDRTVLLTASRGVIVHGLSWFDAHLWAYAERFGLELLYSEDFQDGRVYGGVRIVNPFV